MIVQARKAHHCFYGAAGGAHRFYHRVLCCLSSWVYRLSLCTSLAIITFCLTPPSSVLAQEQDVADESVEGLLRRIGEARRQASERPAPSFDADMVQGTRRESAEAVHWSTLGMVAMGIVALLFAAAYVVERYRSRGEGVDCGISMELTESIWLGRSTRLMLVKVANHYILVGASGAGLTCLAQIPIGSGQERRGDGVPAATAGAENAGSTSMPSEPSSKIDRTEDQDLFADLVRTEMGRPRTNSSPMSKQQILKRLNSL